MAEVRTLDPPVERPLLTQGMRRIVLTATLLGALALAVLWSASTSDDRPMLPDGSRVELLGVAPGTTVFSTEKPWQRLARRVLPSAFQKWIPPAFRASCSSSTNSLSVYVRRTDPGRGLQLGSFWSRVAAVDGDGFEYPPGYGSCSVGDNDLIGVILNAYPRHLPRFLARFYGAEGELLCELHVPNPKPTDWPDWEPEPWPIVRTNAPLVVTLKGFTAEGEGALRHHRPLLDIESIEPAWKSAQPRYGAFSDAQGNRGPFLAPRSRAWKYGMSIARPNDGEFPPEERMLVNLIPVPSAGQYVVLTNAARVDGVEVSVPFLVGAGALTVTNNGGIQMSDPQPGRSYEWSARARGLTEWVQLASDCPFFVILTSDLETETELVFHLRDDAGREIAIEPEPGGYESGSSTFHRAARQYVKRFRPPADDSAVTLEIIVNRGRPFEFLVAPSNLLDNSIAPSKP